MRTQPAPHSPVCAGRGWEGRWDSGPHWCQVPQEVLETAPADGLQAGPGCTFGQCPAAPHVATTPRALLRLRVLPLLEDKTCFLPYCLGALARA